MPAKRHSSLDRVLGRVDRLDTVNLNNLVQRLARERSLLEAVFNTIQEGILVIDAEGVIQYANEMAESLIGRTEGDPEMTLWRLIPGLRKSLKFPQETDEDAPLISREVELTYPQERVVRLYIVPFQGEGSEGDRKRFAVILTDITKEKLSLEKLIENERISSVLLLAAGVAHELGNPLNSLTIHLQLIERKLNKRRAEENHSVLESLEICQEEVRRLDGIIRNFLEAIRPREPDLADLDLVEVLEEVLRFQAEELENRGIRVEIEAAQPFPVVQADRNQVKQVFFNLIKNAMEAMGPGGCLRVKSRADDHSVYLMFGDSGIGIKQEDISRVFQPYRTTKEGGHGLGLMIVQRIMREHGGHIGIESKEGVGTVVTLEFPQKHRRVKLLPS